MQNSAWYHVCWVTGTQFSLSPHTSTSCSMSESHLESWRQLVWFSSFEKVLFLSDFLSFSYFLYSLVLGDFTEKFYPAVGLPLIEGLPFLWMRGEEFSPTILDMSSLTCAPLHTEYLTRGCFAFALAPYCSRFTGWNISVVCLKFSE